jgi:hypothetical protein
MRYRWVMALSGLAALVGSVVPMAAHGDDDDARTLVGAGPVNVTETAFVAQGCEGSVTPEEGVDGWVVVAPDGASTMYVLALPTADASLSVAFYRADCTPAGATSQTKAAGSVPFAVPAGAHWAIVRAHDGFVIVDHRTYFA